MVTVNWDPRVKASLDEVSVAQAGMTIALQQANKMIILHAEYFRTIVTPHTLRQLWY
jgi:hypothetical protein